MATSSYVQPDIKKFMEFLKDLLNQSNYVKFDISSLQEYKLRLKKKPVYEQFQDVRHSLIYPLRTCSTWRDCRTSRPRCRSCSRR